jgi:hypothetical protein
VREALVDVRDGLGIEIAPREDRPSDVLVDLVLLALERAPYARGEHEVVHRLDFFPKERLRLVELVDEVEGRGPRDHRLLPCPFLAYVGDHEPDPCHASASSHPYFFAVLPAGPSRRGVGQCVWK